MFFFTFGRHISKKYYNKYIATCVIQKFSNYFMTNSNLDIKETYMKISVVAIYIETMF